MQSISVEESNPGHLPTGNNINNTFKKAESQPAAIDHLLFSNTLTIDSFSVLEEKMADKQMSLSDHGMLQATFSFNNASLKDPPGVDGRD